MPSAFPSAAHDAVTTRISARSKTHDREFAEFAAGWTAIAYRYFACWESDRAFTQSIERDGLAPQPPTRYLQEHALYVFFASGFSTIESFAYAVHAIGWMLNPPRFDMSSDDQKRNVKPLSTCKTLETASRTRRSRSRCARSSPRTSTTSGAAFATCSRFGLHPAVSSRSICRKTEP
jgi:hypothetical protein